MNKLQYSIEATLTNLSFFSSKTVSSHFCQLRRVHFVQVVVEFTSTSTYVQVQVQIVPRGSIIIIWGLSPTLPFPRVRAKMFYSVHANRPRMNEQISASTILSS